MANLKNISLTVCLILISVFGFSQANLLNAKSPDEIGVRTEEQKELDNDKPLPYGYIDDKDILWSKMVWEIIDLDERVNFPLYYPIDTINIGKNRRSLFDVLWRGVKNGDIDKVYDDSYFSYERNPKQLEASMSLVDTTDIGIEQLNAEGKVDPEFITRRNITAANIVEYHIKGLWYFDKRQGELKYRLLGIAPVAPDVNFIDEENPDLVELFWVWFPDARTLLHESKAFNEKNSAIPISFDHLLNSRRFSGIIYREENVYQDRRIKDYISDNAFLMLLESDRIKEKIRNFEQDMWSR
jgi:gliding motility associated protien GldN